MAMLYEFFRSQFDQNENSMINRTGFKIGAVLAMLAVWLLLLLLGQFLWNNALVPLVPAVRPAQNIWQILGLALLISLLGF